MKDRAKLFFTAIICALLGWAFWHFLGQDAFAALPTLGLVIFAADNVRLRRELRSQDDKNR